jgi:hypothetical protein
MRKTLITLATAAVAALSFGAAATTAFADDPGATVMSDGGSNDTTTTCVTPWRTGVYGQYGAWGYFVDGCTAKVWCPDFAVHCSVQAHSYIDTTGTGSVNPRVTQNMRLRWFSRSGAVKGWQDSSCDRTLRCYPADRYYTIAAGESASTQCNGVWGAGPGYAHNVCFAIIRSLYY